VDLQVGFGQETTASIPLGRIARQRLEKSRQKAHALVTPFWPPRLKRDLALFWGLLHCKPGRAGRDPTEGIGFVETPATPPRRKERNEMELLIIAAILAAIAYAIYRTGKSRGSRSGYFAGRKDGRRQHGRRASRRR
jgi:hypothetical protein